MASNTDYLPDEITYGFVADRVLLAIGDTASDDNRYPDGVPAQGTVRFSPERTILYTQQHPATVLPQDIECTIYHRDHPVAVNNGYEPELVGKLVDPAGHVGNVALIVGWYEVVYRLSTGTAQRFRFQVRPEHTNDDPLWLPEVAPLSPTRSERFVVNEQVYNDTKAARDEAEQFRDTTRTLRNETETYRDQAEAYRDEAGQSATSAAEILSDVQDLGITVDTSVGTRVYVGDTMIHGDTGWRVLVAWNTTGVPHVGQFPEGLSARPNPSINEAFIRGDIRVRRINDNVLLQYSSVQIDAVRVNISAPPAFTASSGATSLSVPTIFRASVWTDILPGYADIRAGEIRLIYPDEAVGKVSTSESSNFISWTTYSDWPTSLPGIPA